MAETNCLAGCVGSYLCGPLDTVENAESLAPWCWIRFGEGADKITVGNQSYKERANTACVKSMEIGWVNTPSFKCEIIDEAGGTLGVVADALRKCIKEEKSKSKGKGTVAEFQFGWIGAECRGGSRLISSSVFKCLILQFEVNYSEGKIKYTIEGGAMDELYNVEKKDEIKGTDDTPVDIEKAIESLMSEDPPCTVRYVELQRDGKLKDVKFEWSMFNKPPKAVWQSDNQNRLSTVMKWLTSFRVKDGKCDKGIVPFFNPDKPNELLLLKDPQMQPGEGGVCANPDKKEKWGPLGTFIVNGGKCSTVIEFNPTMNIINALSTFPVGGSTSGPNKSKNQFVEDNKCQNADGQGNSAGIQQEGTISQQAFDSYGVRVANEQHVKSEIVHNKAAGVVDLSSKSVEAQLKIIGNPADRFCNFAGCRMASVVVINPFHIRGGGCGDWLARPGCNELFTNRQWMATGINHSISPGSYTTTLQLKLVAPSIQIKPRDPLGGQGGGGIVLQNTCEE